jgi:hypothetical protein
MSAKTEKDQDFSDAEVSRRRDDVLRRMVATPPQLKPKKGRQRESEKNVASSEGENEFRAWLTTA